MTVNNAVNVMSGTLVIIGLAFSHLSGAIDMTNISWLWLVAFVGVNLFQMGFTDFCPAKIIFKALGLKDSNNNSSCCS